jgi:hypothetical protein
MSNYLVLIGDIKASKDIEGEERQSVQKKMSQVLKGLNKNENGLISPYTITLGDEFQAVFDDIENIFIDMLKILSVLYPVKVRFSLAVGEIDTSINSNKAIGMDGPAFHKAREGIEQLKKSGFLFNVHVTGLEPSIMNIMNGGLQLLSEELQSWEKQRFKILYMYKEGLDYKAISEKLGIHPSTFYKNKKAGMFDVFDLLSTGSIKIINQKLEQ